MIPRFGRPVPQLCLIFNQTLEFIDYTWGRLLSDFNQTILVSTNVITIFLLLFITEEHRLTKFGDLLMVQQDHALVQNVISVRFIMATKGITA